MPRIQTTKMVKIALFCLRIYLVLLLSLIAYKFISGMKHGKPPESQHVTEPEAPKP
jgi:hypothetical protein